MEGDLDPVDYYGNEELVEHIWSNLLSNAIRFTPAGGQITVVLRRGEGEVTVSVSDTGIGMDEETQRHIFDRFYRAAPGGNAVRREGDGVLPPWKWLHIYRDAARRGITVRSAG